MFSRRYQIALRFDTHQRRVSDFLPLESTLPREYPMVLCIRTHSSEGAERFRLQPPQLPRSVHSIFVIIIIRATNMTLPSLLSYCFFSLDSTSGLPSVFASSVPFKLPFGAPPPLLLRRQTTATSRCSLCSSYCYYHLLCPCCLHRRPCRYLRRRLCSHRSYYLGYRWNLPPIWTV